MKSGRNIHVPKSSELKKRYLQRLESLDYEPTLDETLPFERSNQSSEEVKPIDVNKRRPVAFSEQIKEHFSTHWLGWLLGSVAIFIGYLVTDSKVNFAKIETKLERQYDDIGALTTKTDEGIKKDHSQDLKIQEIDIALKQIGKNIEGIESKMSDMAIRSVKTND